MASPLSDDAVMAAWAEEQETPPPHRRRSRSLRNLFSRNSRTRQDNTTATSDRSLSLSEPSDAPSQHSLEISIGVIPRDGRSRHSGQQSSTPSFPGFGGGEDVIAGTLLMDPSIAGSTQGGPQWRFRPAGESSGPDTFARLLSASLNRGLQSPTVVAQPAALPEAEGEGGAEGAADRRLGWGVEYNRLFGAGEPPATGRHATSPTSVLQAFERLREEILEAISTVVLDQQELEAAKLELARLQVGERERAGEC